VSSIPETIRQQVFTEADHRCEYCRSSRRLIGIPLVIDHILPKSAGGSDAPENLAAACYRCNEFKRAKTHVTDPATGELVSLFNPRQLRWSDHFLWTNGGTHIAGLTPIGRATVVALRLNNDYVVEARALWIGQGWHPPAD
jgi:5-methylcytosine-specific restriction endonuclease McrA